MTEAGLAILEQQFPAYSRPALKQLLEAAGGDVSSALDSMCFLEAEQGNHRAATKPAKSQVDPCRSCTWILACRIRLLLGDPLDTDQCATLHPAVMAEAQKRMVSAPLLHTVRWAYLFR